MTDIDSILIYESYLNNILLFNEEDITTLDELKAKVANSNDIKYIKNLIVNFVIKDAKLSYKYARDVLKDGFELGEEVISKNVYYSYLYAKNILKGRFKLGEDAISKDTYYKKEYEALFNIKL